MKCTECNKEKSLLYSDYYIVEVKRNIIGKTENICLSCAKKRKGFLTLNKIEQNRIY